MYVIGTPGDRAVPLAFQILVLDLVYALISVLYEQTFRRLGRSDHEKVYCWVQVSLSNQAHRKIEGQSCVAEPTSRTKRHSLERACLVGPASCIHRLVSTNHSVRHHRLTKIWNRASILFLLIPITRVLDIPVLFDSLSRFWTCILSFGIAVAVIVHAVVVGRRFARLEQDELTDCA